MPHRQQNLGVHADVMLIGQLAAAQVAQARTAAFLQNNAQVVQARVAVELLK
jgi:hypothetical protein